MGVLFGNGVETVEAENTTSDKKFDYCWTGVSVEFKEKVIEIADKLQMDPDDLMAIMAFESGFDPAIRNKISGATGLIQFMPSTAEALGTTTDELTSMSDVEQLDYVYEYLKGYKGKLNDVYDAYMAVFLPIAVGKEKTYELGVRGSEECFPGTKLSKGKVYSQNAGLDINGDGIITKEEAANKVLLKRNQYKLITNVGSENNVEVTGTSGLTINSNYNMTNTTPWEAVKPQYVYKSGPRDRDTYSNLIDQFNVASNPRYTPRNGATYCNIFAWDVSIAMGVELPRFVEVTENGNSEDATGKSIGRSLGKGYSLYGSNATATELNANRLATWLEAQGASEGWRELTPEEAQQRANEGYMTISVLKNEGKIGHVQVIRPTPDGSGYDGNKGVYISQAGASNFNGKYYFDNYTDKATYERYNFYTHD